MSCGKGARTQKLGSAENRPGLQGERGTCVCVVGTVVVVEELSREIEMRKCILALVLLFITKGKGLNAGGGEGGGGDRVLIRWLELAGCTSIVRQSFAEVVLQLTTSASVRAWTDFLSFMALDFSLPYLFEL